MEIKDVLYNLRMEKRYTLEAVGKMVGTSKQTIARYENGEITNIPYNKLVALAKIYDVTPGYILGWEPKEQILNKNTADFVMDIVDNPELTLLVETARDMKSEQLSRLLKYAQLLSTYNSNDDSKNEL